MWDMSTHIKIVTMFQRFFRTSGSNAYVLTGIMLNFLKEISQPHYAYEGYTYKKV